jgi:hypothetical protein
LRETERLHYISWQARQCFAIICFIISIAILITIIFNFWRRKEKIYSKKIPLKNSKKKSEQTRECKILKIHPETKIFDKKKIKKYS